MPSSMCCPDGPGCQRRSRGASSWIGCVDRREDADPVDPATEVGGHRHVGRGGHDAPADALDACEGRERITQHLLRRGPGGDAHIDLGRLRDRTQHSGRMRRAEGASSRAPAGQQPAFRGAGVEGRPRLVRVDPQRGSQRRDLVGIEHRGVVERVACERQPPAFHGVREDHRGSCPVRVRLVQDTHQRIGVVATKVGDEARQLGVVGPRQDAGQGVTVGGRGAATATAPAVRRRCGG